MENTEWIAQDEAAKQLGVTRATLYYYIRTLGIKAEKFPLDKRKYLKRVDFERIQSLKAQASQRGTQTPDKAVA